MQNVNQKGFWKLRYTVLAILFSGWLFSFFDRMIMGVALPYVGEEFNLNNEQKGLILSFFFAGYAIFQIPGGLLVDKFGVRKVMTTAIIWWSLFTSLTGLIFSFPILLASRFIFGLGEAAFPASSWKTISLYFPSRQKATATAIQGSVNALGPAIATAVAGLIIHHYGWRMVFIILGIPGVIIGIIMYVFIRDNPKQHPLISKHEIAELESDTDLNTANSPETKSSFLDLMKQPILWQLVSIWFLFDIAYWGFVSWLPSYLINARGFNLEQLSLYGSLPFFMGTIALISGGVFSDKLKVNGIHRKWLFIPSAIISAIALYITYLTPSIIGTVIAQCFAAVFLFWHLQLFGA